MAFVQLESYGFTTVENPLSDGGNFSTITSLTALRVPSNGVCEPSATNQTCGTNWTGNVIQVGGTWPADQYSEITLLTDSVLSVFGPIVRCSTSAATYYKAEISGSTGANKSASIISVVAGTPTQIGGSAAITITDGDVYRLSVSGTTLTFLQNGITILTETSSTIASGNPGFAAINDFAITDLQFSLWSAGGNQAATPTFSQTGPTLTISSTTSGGTIYYTTNGSTPTHSSSSIPNGGTIAVLGGQTVKAFESATNFGDSAIGTYMVPSSGAGGGTTNDPFLSPWISNSLRGVVH